MGKGKKAPAKQTVTNTRITGQAEPYYGQLLADSAAIYDPTLAAPIYEGQRLAEAGADQLRAAEMARGIAGSGIAGLGTAMDVTGSNILAAQDIFNRASPSEFTAGTATPYADFQAGSADQYTGFRAGSADQYTGFQAGTATPYADFQAGSADQYTGFEGFSPDSDGAQFSEYAFDPTQLLTADVAEQYMSPYIQNVLDRQTAEARRQFNIAQGERGARAVQSGAFGGSRSAVERALAEESLQRQMGDLYAGGMQSAYQDAQQAFQSDRAAQFGREQAQAGERGRVETGRAGETGRLDEIREREAGRVQAAQAAELARTQGIGIDEATRVQNARAAELARTQGINIDEAGRVQAAQAAELARTQGIGIDEAARVQDARAAELARTQGINIDEAARVQDARAAENARVTQEQLQALGFSSEQAMQLAALGETGRAADIQGAQMLEALGQTDEARRQAGLDMAYQDFLRQESFPMQQLQGMSSILQGVPTEVSQTQTTYAPANTGREIIGTGLQTIGAYKGLQG